MATNSVIGALRVLLGLDSASFETGLKQAQVRAESFAKSVTKIAAGIGLERGIEKGVELIVGGFKDAIKSADELSKAAAKVGLPVEEFTKLKLASDLADVSQETLANGLGKLARSMDEVANGSGKEAEETFKRLGIEVTDTTGRLKSVSEVTAEIAGVFGNTADGASKTAIAMQLFGKSGRELIPLLNEGKDSLAEWAVTAEKMGLVIKQNTAAQADELGDNFDLLSHAARGLANTVAEGVLPAFVRLSREWVDTAKQGDVMRATAASIVSGFKSVVEWVYILKAGNEILGKSFAAGFDAANLFAVGLTNTLVNAFTKLISPVTEFIGFLRDIALWVGDKLIGPFQYFADFVGNYLPNKLSFFTNWFKDTSTAANDNVGPLENFKKKLEGLADTSTFEAAQKRWAEMKTTFDTLNPSIDDVRKRVDELFSSLEVGGKGGSSNAIQTVSAFGKVLDDLKLKTAELRGEFKQYADGFVDLVKGQVTIEQLRAGLSTLSPELQKLNEQQLLFNAAQITQDNLLPWQMYEQQLYKIQQAFAGVQGSAQIVALASRKAAEATGQAWDLAASKIVGDLASGLKAFAAQNKSLSAAAKAAAIAQAIINTYTAATKALATYPPPLSYAAAGAAVVAGLGYVAQIKAQEFAHGGSFRVGGTGGTDSQLIQFKATPGEMVDIRTPGTDAGPPSSGSESRAVSEVVVPFRRLTDVMTADDFKGMVDGLNRAHRDGYKLVSAQR